MECLLRCFSPLQPLPCRYGWISESTKGSSPADNQLSQCDDPTSVAASSKGPAEVRAERPRPLSTSSGFVLPVATNVPALSVSFAIETVIPVLVLGRPTHWRLNTFRCGIIKPERRAMSDRGAMCTRSFGRSMRWGRAKPAMVCVSCRGSALGCRGWLVAVIEHRRSSNRPRRLFPTTLALASSRIVERMRTTTRLDRGGIGCGHHRRGRVRAYSLNLRLGAIPGNIVDEPLTRAC